MADPYCNRCGKYYEASTVPSGFCPECSNDAAQGRWLSKNPAPPTGVRPGLRMAKACIYCAHSDTARKMEPDESCENVVFCTKDPGVWVWETNVCDDWGTDPDA